MAGLTTAALRERQPLNGIIRLPRAVRKTVAGYLLLLPASLLVLGLVAYPTLYTIWLSFSRATGFSGPGEFIGLGNYRVLVADPQFWEGVRNALVVGGLTVVLEVPLGVATALLLWWKFWGRPLVFIAVFIPWVYPAAFSGFAWYWMFTPPFHTFYTVDVVLLRAALEAVIGPGWWAFLSVVMVNMWRGSSFIAIFLLAALNAIPSDVLDYARIESSSAWERFRYVIAPLIWPFLVLAVLVSLAITYIDFTNVYIQTGGRVYEPMPLTQSYVLSIRHGMTGLGAATVAIQFPLIALLLAAGFRMIDGEGLVWRTRGAGSTRAGEATEASADALAENTPELPRARLGGQPAAAPQAVLPSRSRSSHPGMRRRALAALGAIAALFVAAFHLFPIYWTVIQAIRPISEDVGGNPFWVQHPKLDAFLDILNDDRFWVWMRNSGIIFGSALLLALVSSLLAGYALARYQLPGSRWLARLLFASYFVPQTAIIVPIYQVFLALRIEDTMLSVVLLYQTLAIPFCTWLFYLYFRGLPADLEESASLDAGRAAVFWRVVVRMSWPVIVAAGVFAVGVMASDLLYASTFLLHHGDQTVVQGLGVIEIDLDEWNNVTGGIGLGALPIVLACAAFAPSYVRGLTAAMLEGA